VVHWSRRTGRDVSFTGKMKMVKREKKTTLGRKRIYKIWKTLIITSL